MSERPGSDTVLVCLPVSAMVNPVLGAGGALAGVTARCAIASALPTQPEVVSPLHAEQLANSATAIPASA
jgi:hypothetical protein